MVIPFYYSFPPNCGFDTVGNMLRHLLGTELAPLDNNWQQKGVLRRFEQKLYLDSTIFEVDGLEDYGYVYYPYSCLSPDKKCKLHVALHGCGA